MGTRNSSDRTRTTPPTPRVASPAGAQVSALNEGAPAEAPRVEVILISRNSADSGLRIFNSIATFTLRATERAASATARCRFRTSVHSNG